MLDSKTYFLPDFLGSHKELSSIGNEVEMTRLQFESVIKRFSFQKGELQSLFIKKFINLENPVYLTQLTVLLNHFERTVSGMVH